MSNDSGSMGDLPSSDEASSQHQQERSGLESIALVALQALQHQGLRSNEEEGMIAANGCISNQKPPDLPCAMNLASRIVSGDKLAGGPDKADCATQLRLPTQSHADEGSPKPIPRKFSTVAGLKKSVDSSPPTIRGDSIESTSPTNAPSDAPSSEENSVKPDHKSKVADFSKILADPESWLKETENMFAKLPPIEPSQQDIIVQPNDVLCGRGGETNHHPGNVRYRSLVKAYQKLYLLAKRRDKPKIAQCIVVSVRGVNGRFLKRVKDTSKPEGSVWMDVGNVKAREKTSQALREGAPDLRETVHTETPVVATVGASSGTSSNATVPTSRENHFVSSNANMVPISMVLNNMMEWRNQSDKYGSTNGSYGSNEATSAGTDLSTSENNMKTISATNAQTLTAQAFTAATAKLMQHPVFHQLEPSQQQQAILHELNVAKAAASSLASTAESSKNLTVGPTPTQEGKLSLINRELLPQEYALFYAQRFAKFPRNGDLKQVNTLELADSIKHLPISGMGAAYGSKNNPDITNSDAHGAVDKTGDLFVNARKRQAPPSFPYVGEAVSAHNIRLTNSANVVSDSGSEASSTSSSFSSPSMVNDNSSKSSASTNVDKPERIREATETTVSTVHRRGSRLKRLKLRMQDDFKS